MKEQIKQFTITKKIAKHGKQTVIVVPKILEAHLKPGIIVEMKGGIEKNERKSSNWTNSRDKSG